MRNYKLEHQLDDTPVLKGRNPYQFMENKKTTLEDIRKVINESAPGKIMYVDEMLIEIIENLYNVKFILFETVNVPDSVYKNILEFPEERIINIFLRRSSNTIVMTRPRYIMLYFELAHYQLVLYKNKGHFEFNELPELVKCLVKEKFGDSFTVDINNYNTCEKR